MASIQFHPSPERRIEEKYRLSGIAQPTQPDLIGGAIWISVIGWAEVAR